MTAVELFPHQVYAVDYLEKYKNALLQADLGLGKTFISLALAKKQGRHLVVLCQSSKVTDWEKAAGLFGFDKTNSLVMSIDTAWRRPELFSKLNEREYTLIVDESQQIKNTGTKRKPVKRTRFILDLKPTKTIMLSGTPFEKWEQAYSQYFLLKRDMSEDEFLKRYTIRVLKENRRGGQRYYEIVGYRNINELKKKLADAGHLTMSYDDALTMSPALENIPPQMPLQVITCEASPEYKKLRKNRLAETPDGDLIIADNISKFRHAERQFSSAYNKYKLSALADLIESTNNRLIVFYQYQADLTEILKMLSVAKIDRPISIMNGQTKDLKNYEERENSLTFVQWQSGARGLDLQKANVTVFFSLTDSFELFYQSFGRTHRIGQTRPCYYYLLETTGSIDGDIKKALDNGEDFTESLYSDIRGLNNGGQ